MSLLVKRLAWWTIIVVALSFLGVADVCDASISEEPVAADESAALAIIATVVYGPVLLLSVLMLFWKHRTAEIRNFSLYAIVWLSILQWLLFRLFSFPLDVLFFYASMVPVFMFGVEVRNQELRVRKAREAAARQQEDGSDAPT